MCDACEDTGMLFDPKKEVICRSCHFGHDLRLQVETEAEIERNGGKEPPFFFDCGEDL
jgi:hypothetical protein